MILLKKTVFIKMKSNNQMISYKDISVVVQGPIDKDYTSRCLKSIRKYLPESIIILSTWEGSNVEGLDYDILVLNKDPGYTYVQDPQKTEPQSLILNNVNRQIISTINGLKKVKTPYSLKLRTDFEIRGTGFLKYFDKYKNTTEEMKVFKKRIVSFCQCFSDRTPFHPCDFIFFGLTSDLQFLYDIPLQSEEEANWFLKNNPVNAEQYIIYQGSIYRFCPEMHLWKECLNKKYPNIMSKFQDLSDNSDENIKNSDLSYVNNFVGINAHQWNVFALKPSLERLNVKKFKGHHIMNYKNWLKLYFKYIAKSNILYFLDFLIINIKDLVK